MTPSGSRRIVIVLVGLAMVIAALALPHPGPAWGALCAVWLLASGAALGLVALLAATRITGARWIEPLVEFCRAGLLVLPWSFAVLLVLVAAGPRWIPWLQGGWVLKEGQHWWFNLPTFALREIVCSAILYALAVRVVNVPRWSAPALTWSVAFLLAFAGVLTLWALDFIMALDREWVSTLIGVFYFMGSLLAATGLLGLEASRKKHPDGLRHDVGKLLFGLSVFWACLLWAQFLTQWYGNLPEEVGFWLLRKRAPWFALSLGAMALVFLVPFFVLMRESAKRDQRILGPASVGVLVGLGLTLLLLILPALDPKLSPGAILALAGSLIMLAPLLGVLGNVGAAEVSAA